MRCKEDLWKLTVVLPMLPGLLSPDWTGYGVATPWEPSPLTAQMWAGREMALVGAVPRSKGWALWEEPHKQILQGGRVWLREILEGKPKVHSSMSPKRREARGRWWHTSEGLPTECAGESPVEHGARSWAAGWGLSSGTLGAMSTLL